MNLIDIHSLENKDSLEASELRSSLLFGHRKIRDSRDSIMMKAIFAVILYLPETERSFDKILNAYNENLCHEGGTMGKEQFLAFLSKLVDAKMITISGDMVSVRNVVNAQKYIDDLHERTEKVIDGIIQRTEQEYQRKIAPNLKTKLSNNVKKALSVYFKLAGFEFFNLSKKSHDDETEDAVSVTMRGITDGKLSNSLVIALGEAVHSTDPDIQSVMNEWAKAHISTQVMNLDPSLRQFKLKQLRDKQFILDTDFVLNCLTKKARFSEMYRQILSTLVGPNCSSGIRIPEEVISEVYNHAQNAHFLYVRFGEKLMELPDYILETELSNVFLEDYVKIKRYDPECEDLDFKTYMSNIIDARRPSFLQNSIAKLSDKIKIGIEGDSNDIQQQNGFYELNERIFQEICKSQKGSKRDDEINRSIAKTDTILYLAVYNLNKGLEDKYALAKKAYLVSRSTRSMRCAKNLKYEGWDVICRPKTLISVFTEMGLISGGDRSVINLFENPFLAYTAHRIWPDVKGLMDVGAQLKHQEIDRLRYEYEDSVNSVLTAHDPKEFEREIRKWCDKNYSWAQNTSDLLKKIENLQKSNMEKDEIIAQKEDDIEKLKKKRRKPLDKNVLVKAHKYDKKKVVNKKKKR